jgi:hypothetical protein
VPGDLFPEFRNGKRVQALQSLLAQKVSVLAANGIQFDLSTLHWCMFPQGANRVGSAETRMNTDKKG